MPPFRQVGDVITFKAHGRRQHIIGMARGFGFADIDADQQVERLHRSDHLVLIGKGYHRVTANHDKRLDLAIAGGKDFIGEDVARHFLAQLRQPAEARGRKAFTP